MPNSRLTVSIVVYNSDDVIEDCLRSFSDASDTSRPRILVVDNASPDSSVEKARGFHFTELIRSEVNRGFAGGHNLCWERISSDYWLLLNPDARMATEQADELVRWMDENSDVALASPALVDTFGQSLHTERRFPSIARSLVLFLRLHFLFTETMKARYFAGPFAQRKVDSKDADWVPGTAIIARRSAVEEIGQMSEEFPMYGEDVEWCWRFKDAGWKIGVVNRFTVAHLGGTSAARSFGADEKLARMERATFDVLVRMKGRVYAMIWTALEVVITGTETLHPGRSATERALSAKRLGILLGIFMSRS